MAVDLNSMIAAEQAAAFRRQGDGGAAVEQSVAQGGSSYLNSLDRVMLREYTEPSFVEAEAMKETKGNPDVQYAAGLRTTRIVPEPDAKPAAPVAPVK